MLKGYDMSHHQTNAVYNEYVDKCDFMIIKATEGKTYTDDKFKERAKDLNERGLLNGFYHYARPENNFWKDEALHFYNTIKNYINQYTIIILDWEGNSLKHSFDWALNFCAKMEALTNKPCIIYASASVVKKYAKQYKYWWTAHYNSKCENGCNHDGVEEVMIQFTSKPIDCDVFKGNLLEWYKLCGNELEKSTKILYEWIEGNKHYKLICEE